MNVRLVVERRRQRVWSAEVRGSQATVGRALGSTVRIPSSEVSRLHCRLRVEDGLVTVEDMESVNGTFLNGQRVRDVQMVRPGDRLTVGPVTFVVEYELTPTVLERLRDEASEVEILEADDVAEVLEEIAEPVPVPARKARPAPAEPVEVLEADEEDMLIFDAEEVNLPESGNLRDILLELDGSDDRSA